MTDTAESIGRVILGPELAKCMTCGAVGLPKRIDEHNCQDFLDCQQEGQ